MNKDYINAWIDIAIKDIEASKVLYNSKFYSNSFYHFQQASEKGLKAYAFISKTFTEKKDANKISHYTLQIFKDSVEEQQKGLEFLKQFNFDKLFDGDDFGNYAKNLGLSVDILPKKKEIYQYSKKNLDEIIKIIDGLKNYSLELPNDFEKKLKEKNNDFVDIIRNINPVKAKELEVEFDKIYNDDKELLELCNYVKNYYDILIKESYYLSVLFYCNLLSHEHNNFSRYPDDDFNPLKYYSLRKPIVKLLPFFNQILYDTLVVIRKRQITD